MHLHDNELHALVQHLAAANPPSGPLKNAWAKLHNEAVARKKARTAIRERSGEVSSADVMSARHLTAVFVEPRAADGAKKPRAIPDILKSGGRLGEDKTPEEMLQELGLF